MTRGECDYAVRKAYEAFDRWNDVTGAIHKGCSWYYECLAVIEDCVKIGAKIATYGIEADLSEFFEEVK